MPATGREHPGGARVVPVAYDPQGRAYLRDSQRAWPIGRDGDPRAARASALPRWMLRRSPAPPAHVVAERAALVNPLPQASGCSASSTPILIAHALDWTSPARSATPCPPPPAITAWLARTLLGLRHLRRQDALTEFRRWRNYRHWGAARPRGPDRRIRPAPEQSRTGSAKGSAIGARSRAPGDWDMRCRRTSATLGRWRVQEKYRGRSGGAPRDRLHSNGTRTRSYIEIANRALCSRRCGHREGCVVGVSLCRRRVASTTLRRTQHRCARAQRRELRRTQSKPRSADRALQPPSRNTSPRRRIRRCARPRGRGHDPRAALIDIDQTSKETNDHFGHAVGDACWSPWQNRLRGAARDGHDRPLGRQGVLEARPRAPTSSTTISRRGSSTPCRRGVGR